MIHETVGDGGPFHAAGLDDDRCTLDAEELADQPGQRLHRSTSRAAGDRRDGVALLLAAKGIYIVDFRGSDELIYSYYDDAAKSSKYINYNLNTQVTADTQYDYATRSYVFSHDKKHKAFIENRDGKNNVYLVDGNNGNENKLTAIDTAQSPVYWSLDDKIIFFNSTKTGENALYLISLDGAKPKKIVDISYEGYGYGQ
jgi:Tol biopolymer transport system component